MKGVDQENGCHKKLVHKTIEREMTQSNNYKVQTGKCV
jgi:hypothetical protein